MDVVQLKTLIHVAELGSLSKAADRIGVAQPALSRQIRLLEAELGVSLFTRHGRGMILTEIGNEVLLRAGNILNELDDIRFVTSGEQELRGVVAIGTTPTVAEIATLPLVREVKNAQPLLRLRLTSAFSGYLIDWLQRGEIEVAVSYETYQMHSLRVHPVMNEELLLVRVPHFTPDRGEEVEYARLAEMDLVLPSPRHGLRRILDQLALKASIELRPHVEADSFGALTSLVRSGIGATVLPLAPIYNLVKSGKLCASRLVNPSAARDLVVAFSADRAVTPAARYVGETFKAIARDLVEKGVWAGRMNL